MIPIAIVIPGHVTLFCLWVSRASLLQTSKPLAGAAGVFLAFPNTFSKTTCLEVFRVHSEMRASASAKLLGDNYSVR